MFSRNRAGRKGGRVALYVKEHYTSTLIKMGSKEETVEALWVRIHGG